MCIPLLELEFVSETRFGVSPDLLCGSCRGKTNAQHKAKEKELKGEGLLYSHLGPLEKALDKILLDLYWHLFQQVTAELFHVFHECLSS